MAESIVYLSRNATEAAAFDVLQPEKVLIVTAHPDDEVMFFAPTVLALTSLGVQVHALCLSIGNAENLGGIRQQELFASYAALGVPSDQVQSIDDPLVHSPLGWIRSSFSLLTALLSFCHHH